MRRGEFWICPCSLSEFTNKQFLKCLCTFCANVLVLVIIGGLAYIWKLQFKNCMCDSQAFGVYSLAIENSSSQGRTALRLSSV